MSSALPLLMTAIPRNILPYEALKHTLHIKMAEELRAKAEKGEATASDAMAALMLAAIMKKESEED